MSGAITGAGARTPVDYGAIERRIKTELQESNDIEHPDLASRAESAETRYYDIMRENARDHDRNNTWRNVGIISLGAGIGLAAGAGLGALAARSGSGAASGAALGAGFGAFATTIGLGVHSFFDDLFGLESRTPPPDSAEFRVAEARFKELRLELDALPNPEKITPDDAWMSAPATAAWPNGTSKVDVGDWVEQVFERHDHDGDGELRIADTSDTAGNELIRNAVEGAYTKDAYQDPVLIAAARQLPVDELDRFDTDGDGRVTDPEVALALARPRTIDGLFGVTAAQLQRFDLDDSDTLSREELAEGIVRDSVGEYHGMYYVTNADGTIPRTLEEMRDGWAARGGSLDT